MCALGHKITVFTSPSLNKIWYIVFKFGQNQKNLQHQIHTKSVALCSKLRIIHFRSKINPLHWALDMVIQLFKADLILSFIKSIMHNLWIITVCKKRVAKLHQHMMKEVEEGGHGGWIQGVLSKLILSWNNTRFINVAPFWMVYT